jgi:5-(carboxyamino)imidazole ribonucleotide mutase
MADPQVLIVMGSDTDLPVLEEAAKILAGFGIAFEMRIASAHRSPARTANLATAAAGRGIRVIIAGAGMAAHLAGVLAAETVLPVIGVPTGGGALGGVDALYATVQMPGGIPVATMAIGKAGGKNAGIFAVQILALGDERLTAALYAHRAKMAEDVAAKDRTLQEGLAQTHGRID